MFFSYVLITPARNEAAFIELTLQSVTSQNVKPLKWVIVSDGSTDQTDEIVRRYQAEHPWIELVQVSPRRERSFSGKVHAFNLGHERVKSLDYDAIASLDGDISFDPDYFAFLLGKLAADPKLGLVGTPFQEHGTPVYDYRFVNIEHVSGACQMFRRACFEQIGGYVPVKGGGIDYIAVVTSRMKGWSTRTFPEKVCHHHRPMGTAESRLLTARFKMGVKDYVLGNHLLWQVSRSAYQATQKPLLLGGVMVLAGYVWALVRRTERPVSREFIAFVRREQMQRLTRFARRGTTYNRQAGAERAC
jgi:glycosyltransferase involved in cell wall biosynthesis